MEDRKQNVLIKGKLTAGMSEQVPADGKKSYNLCSLELQGLS